MEETKNNTFPVKAMLKYLLITGLSLIYWELVMAVKMGGIKPSSFFFLFFIPAEALILVALCGFGNELSSRITLPIVLFLPAIYYIIQAVYHVCFGSLFSISMAGMGTNALGDFGWALKGVVGRTVPIVLIILVPIFFAIVVSIKNFVKVEGYRWQYHFVMVAFAIALWFIGLLGVRLFGTERTSPYYLYTSTQATTDATAKKLGVITTGVVESGSYYFGFGQEEENGFIYDEDEDWESEDENTQTVAKSNDVITFVDDLEDDTPKEEEVVRVPWENEALDFAKIISETDNKETKELAEFFNKRKPSETNEYTGMFEGYNLIYICAESFWNYACNEDVTPTLYKMAHNGIVLVNYYNSFYNTTTNGEFALCTSLWPDVSRHSSAGTDIGSFAQSASKFMPQGLGNLFSAQGIPAYAFHNYYGKYYRRILSWPNLGYKCKFTGDGMRFTSNWPASDLELMQQSVDDFINDDQFHVYYMTFSGHGPFASTNYMVQKNLNEVTAALGESKYNVEARSYFAGELEFDKAMEYLLDRLKEAGKLDNTVIVIAGDHYPYYLTNEGCNSLAGYNIDQKFDIYKSNCIIYNAGMETPLSVDSYCSNVDIAPTILNLFNIPFDSRLMAGRDIFSESAHNRAVLYNMSFITDKVKYDSEADEAIWTEEGNKLSDSEKAKYIKSQLNSIENEYNASCLLIENNFMLKAYKICGILTDDEINKEIAREEEVKTQDETYNAEDEAEAAQKELELLQQQGLMPMDADPNAVTDPADLGVDPATNPGGTDPAANPPVNPLTDPAANPLPAQ